MLKEKQIPHVQGCLENEKRINQLEEILLVENGLLAAKECAKGAVEGTVNLMAELAEIKHDITLIKEKINELITYVKNKT